MNKNEFGKVITTPEELFTKRKEDRYQESLYESSDKLSEIWNELHEIIIQLSIAKELKEWETSLKIGCRDNFDGERFNGLGDINVQYFMQLLKTNENAYEALLKPEERGLVPPEEILMKRKEDKYKETLLSSVNKLVEIRESIFAIILYLSLAGELKEWEANIEIGETFEFTKELFLSIKDENVQSLVKLLDAVENTFDTLININNLKI